MAESVTISALTKAFVRPDAPGDPVLAVRNVDLEVREGELVTLLGPSGCGKTTLLRMIAGFEEPTSGEIRFGDRLMNQVPPNRRDATMVFQSYAIFPHLDVYENVAFGLRLKPLALGELASRVDRVLDLTGLTAMARRSPSQLSGGQQQRVALARAIVMEPQVLLFDEPLSNLDAKLREQMRVEIRDLQQRVGITSLYVTHDQVEAMSISDRIVVMNGGVVEQVGTPEDIYARPATRFVADFIGKANFVEARMTGPRQVEVAGTVLELAEPQPAPDGARVTLVIRPEAVRLSRDGGVFQGTIRRSTFLGNVAEYLVDLPGTGTWLVDDSSPTESGLLRAGEEVHLTPSAKALRVLPL